MPQGLPEMETGKLDDVLLFTDRGDATVDSSYGR
jgi:hypothetical protein